MLGYWWGDGTAPLGPSVFLTEVRYAGAGGSAGPWAEPPDDDAANPLLASVDEADWPATPAGQYYAAVRSAGHLVETARDAGHQGELFAVDEPAPPRKRHRGRR